MPSSSVDRKLKILHVIRSVDPVGGGPIEGIQRQAEVTRDLAVREVVCLDRSDAPYVASFPLKVHALGDSSPHSGPLARYGYSRDFVPWLRANGGRYDAVIVNGLWNYASFGASRALPKLTTPYFVFPHGMMDPWFRRASPLKHLAKQLFWFVGEGRLAARARAVLFTSEEERRAARGVFLGHHYREQVVGYGTAAPPQPAPSQTDAFLKAVPDLAGRPYLLFLSRIHPKKGCDILIDAFAAVAHREPNLQLVVAGPDETGWAHALQRQARDLGVADRVHWAGMLRGDAKWGAFRGAEAFILPSHQENFGIVVAESLACGIPVLISDKINIWREISDAGAGLVQSDTADGATQLLIDWLELSAGERLKMASHAAKLFSQKFDVKAAGPALIERIRMTS